MTFFLTLITVYALQDQLLSYRWFVNLDCDIDFRRQHIFPTVSCYSDKTVCLKCNTLTSGIK